MSTVPTNNITSQQNAPTSATNNQKQKKTDDDTMNVMALAYLYLMDSATISSETAQIQAKGMQALALKEEQLNDKAANQKWNYLPTVDVHHWVSYKKHTYWSWHWHLHSGFMHTTYKKVTHTTVKGQTAFDNAQAKNTQVAADRQTLTEEVASLQQQQQTESTNAGTTNQNASATMQEAQGIVQAVRDLTFKAMMRQPIQT